MTMLVKGAVGPSPNPLHQLFTTRKTDMGASMLTILSQDRLRTMRASQSMSVDMKQLDI